MTQQATGITNKSTGDTLSATELNTIKNVVDANGVDVDLRILNNRIIVNQANAATTLGGVIDSTKEYFLDGVIDMGANSITIPVGGITIRGYSFGISALISTEASYTLFVSETAIIGSGGLDFTDFYITTSGVSSKVYELYDVDGSNAIEVSKVNYNDCTSLGDLHEYRQGLEFDTGRFGGSPSLTLHGTWAGGFRIATSICRGMSDSTEEPLFKAGTAFLMTSRFLTDINCDLGTLQPFCDFATGNFVSPSSLEFVDVLLTRDGVIDPEDTNLTPNITQGDIKSAWKGNHGLHNTFVGGKSDVTVEVETTITTQGDPYVLLGTQVADDLQHFDSPANGQLRFIGSNPIEYTVSWDFVLDGQQNAEYRLDLCRDRGGVKSIVHSQIRTINNLQGGRDVAYYTGASHEHLWTNDFTYWEVTNLTGTGNCTLELNSDWIIDHR
jgi:hypothetical protein